jgi:hypothetical protein
MTSTLTPHTPRELCSRSSDGIEVALLWTPATDQLAVTVVDLRSNDSFQLPVDAHHAMHAFHHPYPHADECGMLDPGPDHAPASVPDLLAEETAP